MRENSSQAMSGIPMPVVVLNRWMLVIGISTACLLQQPWIVAALLVVILSAIAFGPRGSLPFQVATRMFTDRVQAAKQRGDVEDRRLMRFNNSIAAILLTLSLIGFGVGANVTGWFLAGMVAAAAGVALAGFCVGCFVFYRFRLAQSQWRSN